MKKDTSKKVSKSQNTKDSVRKTAKVSQKSVAQNIDCKRECFNPWSLSIYVYWFIILFFIASTFYILGRSHNVLNGKTDNNVEITEEALMQSADYYESGKNKLLAGNIEDAIADLTTAIDAGNASIETYILRGEAYMQSGDYSNAMVDFNHAINTEPTNAVAYFDRSLLFTRLEDYNSALNDINAALSAAATNPSSILAQRDLYAKRGQLNLWLKNWEGAIADYTNSLARPDGTVKPSVYAERAEAFTALGQYENAINDYGAAVRVISEQIQGATTAAEREQLSSNAMTYFEKSAALNLQLGNIDASRNDLQSAYTIAAALNDTESVNRLQGLLMEMQGGTSEPAPQAPAEPAPASEVPAPDAPTDTPVTPEMPTENQQ